jgi:hypothetical protein
MYSEMSVFGNEILIVIKKTTEKKDKKLHTYNLLLYCGAYLSTDILHSAIKGRRHPSALTQLDTSSEYD